jgi:hypothetical protein
MLLSYCANTPITCPKGDSARFVGHQVRLHVADDGEALLPEVGERRFLNHEIARKAVQPLNEDRADAVRVELFNISTNAGRPVVSIASLTPSSANSRTIA